jgi:hypothetical protein
MLRKICGSRVRSSVTARPQSYQVDLRSAPPAALYQPSTAPLCLGDGWVPTDRLLCLPIDAFQGATAILQLPQPAATPLSLSAASVTLCSAAADFQAGSGWVSNTSASSVPTCRNAVCAVSSQSGADFCPTRAIRGCASVVALTERTLRGFIDSRHLYLLSNACSPPVMDR